MKSPKNRKHFQKRLLTFKEPRLRFGFDQVIEDPKDGLLLFGPPEKPLGVQYGVIGPPASIRRFEAWAGRLSKPVEADPAVPSSVMFPGFETIFRMPWEARPSAKIDVSADELATRLRNTDPYQRVYDTVELFAEPIKRWVNEEDIKVALWFVVIPDDVWKSCRPKSIVSKREGIVPHVQISHHRAMSLISEPEIFDEVNAAAEKHLYENHFHNQLKARLLGCEAVTQLIRESTIAPHDFLNRFNKPKRRIQDAATVAWNLSTTAYYKAGAKPWTLADIREGVCYIGLVFKRTNNPGKDNEACCGAQMFLHSGEGIVFRGSVGPWASEKPGEFHLNREKAAEVVRMCVESYKNKHDNQVPRELFIHGRTIFNEEEIAGFREGARGVMATTGIQIRRANDIKLYREGHKPVLRGLALRTGGRSAFLWTSGYVPHLGTYPGREVPTPLKVKIVFGETDLEHVLADIVALTKLNFNACIFADGLPVTLRFADDIGEILTAIPPNELTKKPLPFRNYI